MLFNSYRFLFGFLPVALVGFYVLGSWRKSAALGWLIAVSLVFYAWWRPMNVAIMAPSVLLNYGLARLLVANRDNSRRTSAILLFGIAFNVCFLGYFKYLNFFTHVADDVFGTEWVLERIILPLGISFITFQKIGFLMDVAAGRIERFSFKDFCLFVLFFPQVVAGPIVHYNELMPEFERTTCRVDAEAAACGITLLMFGLFKKVVFADSIAHYVSPIYAAVAAGKAPDLSDAWIATLGFTLQIYFDFAGYSDMALGLARLFGVRLPPNFNSPLRATNIIDFWSRWHMTLTRFLTSYVYTPMVLSLARKRMRQRRPVLSARQWSLPAFAVTLAYPTVFTMGLSGLWHGAGYTYVLWGLLHGVYIVINHGWRELCRRWKAGRQACIAITRAVGYPLTFLSVVFTMALFRAPSVHVAIAIWKGMVGRNGLAIPEPVIRRFGAIGHALTALGAQATLGSGGEFVRAWAWVVVLLAIAVVLPNTYDMTAEYGPAVDWPVVERKTLLSRVLAWQPSTGWAVITAAATAVGVLSLGQLSEFIYWQF